MTADLTDRLAEAVGVPALLAVAYDVFEHILRALRGTENQAGTLLPAIVLAAAAAGDGRDAVARAPWLPEPPEPPEPPISAGSAEQVADKTAALSRALWERLAAADAPADYRAACAGGGSVLPRPPRLDRAIRPPCRWAAAGHDGMSPQNRLLRAAASARHRRARTAQIGGSVRVAPDEV